MVCWVYSLELPQWGYSNEYTHNIQFHDKIRKFPYIRVFLTYRKNFVGIQKQVQISHSKRAISVHRCSSYWGSTVVCYQKISPVRLEVHEDLTEVCQQVAQNLQDENISHPLWFCPPKVCKEKKNQQSLLDINLYHSTGKVSRQHYFSKKFWKK